VFVQSNITSKVVDENKRENERQPSWENELSWTRLCDSRIRAHRQIEERIENVNSSDILSDASERQTALR
jgi:hypothetical protein